MSGSTAATTLDTTKAAVTNDVSVTLTTLNDTLIEALFIFHCQGEEACVGMLPQYGGNTIMIKKLVERLRQSKTGLYALDNNEIDAEMVREELLEITTTNNTLVEALFIFHCEGEKACVSMFPQYGPVGIIKKLVEICKQSKTGSFALDNNDAEMVKKVLLKINDFVLKPGQIRNQIVDMAPLATLVNLTTLDLSSNQIVDVVPLAKLVNLTSLHLPRNRIVDVAPLATLVNLTCLFLGGNQIVDMAPLATLVNLTSLDLRRNPIVDVAPLATLVNLTTLDLRENQIVDVAPLETLVNLTTLNLYSNQIVDVSPLATLANLTSLNLSSNQIVDVAPLATLVNLTWLYLHENQIVDTTPLRSLPKTTKIEGVVVHGGCCTIV